MQLDSVRIKRYIHHSLARYVVTHKFCWQKGIKRSFDKQCYMFIRGKCTPHLHIYGAWHEEGEEHADFLQKLSLCLTKHYAM
jgi:hypothetical protein